MEKVKKVGEITCVDDKFEDWVRERLENTDYVVRSYYEPGCDTTYEIYSKTK